MQITYTHMVGNNLTEDQLINAPSGDFVPQLQLTADSQTGEIVRAVASPDTKNFKSGTKILAVLKNLNGW